MTRSDRPRIKWVSLLARPRPQPLAEELSRFESEGGPAEPPAPAPAGPVLGEDATD